MCRIFCIQRIHTHVQEYTRKQPCTVYTHQVAVSNISHSFIAYSGCVAVHRDRDIEIDREKNECGFGKPIQMYLYSERVTNMSMYEFHSSMNIKHLLYVICC